MEPIRRARRALAIGAAITAMTVAIGTSRTSAGRPTQRKRRTVAVAVAVGAMIVAIGAHHGLETGGEPEDDAMETFDAAPLPATDATVATRGFHPGDPDGLGSPGDENATATAGTESGAEQDPASGVEQDPAAETDGDAEDTPRELHRKVRVRSGDTLGGVLERAGVDRARAHEAIAALRDVFNPRDLRPGQIIAMTLEEGLDGAADLVDLSLEPSIDSRVFAVRDGERFTASITREPLQTAAVRGHATITSSLYESAVAARIPIPLLFEVVRAFSYDIDFQRDIQPGDSFEVLYDQERTRDGKPVSDKAIRFAALTLSGKRMPLYRFVDGAGLADYYDESGRNVRKALLKTPIDGARLSSGFGPRRHPVLGYNRMHRGVDFAAVTGTPVFAAGDARVDKAESFGSFGNYVRLRHTATYSTAYAHLSRFAKGLRAGATVRQGQVIGYVGSTGRSTGPHLHYEVLKNNAQVNPVNIRFPSGRTLAGKDLKRFAAERDTAKRELAALAKPSGGDGIRTVSADAADESPGSPPATGKP